MGQFLQVNGDYNIKTREGSKITLDPGLTGQVRVTGDLVVEGDTLTVSAENLNVNDNIIILNYGETGPGVSLQYSGIEIDRGSYVDSSQVPRAVFLFDESIESWIIANGSVPNPLSFENSNLKLRRIYTDLTQPDLILIRNGSGVVNVGNRELDDDGVATGDSPYETLVVDEDDVPNKKYVDDAIQNNPTFQIRSPGVSTAADTRIIIADSSVTPNNSSTPGSIEYFKSETSTFDVFESTVGVFVDGIKNTYFHNNRTVIQDLEIQGTTISTDELTNSDIRLRTQGTGRVVVEYGIAIENEAHGTIAGPSYFSGATVLYTGAEETGNSGVFFVASSQNRDELMSRRRSLVWSMLF